MQITTYRIEHPRLTACWVAEWQEWAGEHNESWWSEYDEEDEAIQVADAIGGIVVEVNRPMNYGDIARQKHHYMQAAE